MANILIVEDQDDIRELFRSMLEHSGHTVEVAQHGLEGMQQLKKHPDLVLLDLSMPMVSGDAVLGFIRSTPEMAQTKVLVVSALPKARLIAEQLNADACLTKPVSFDQLITTINDLLG